MGFSVNPDLPLFLGRVLYMVDFLDFIDDSETEQEANFRTKVKTEEEIEKWATDPNGTEVTKALWLLKRKN